MAEPRPDELIPVTLPDGRVVRMMRTPGLDAAGVTAADDPSGLNPYNPAIGGGGLAPIQVTPKAPPELPAGATDEQRVRNVFDPAVSMSMAPGVETIPTTPKEQAGKIANVVSGQGNAGDTTDVPDPMGAGATAAPRGHYVEGGPQKAAWQVQKGEAITGERQDATEGAYDRRIGLADQAAAAAEEAQANARIEAGLANLQRQDLLDQERSRRMAIDRDIQALNSKRDEMQAAAEAKAVDPSRLIKEKPWAAMIAGLGMALQGAAQREAEIRAGQPFRPLASENWLKDAVDRDIEAQQLEYEQATDAASVANNRYREAIDLYGTPEAAKQALAAQDLGVAQRWLEIRQQEATDQTQLAALKAVAADVELEKQKHLAELETAAADKVTEQWKQTPGQWVGPGGPGAASKIKPGSKEALELADLEEQERAALAAEQYANSLVNKGESSLPGYSLPGAIAKKALTGIAGNAGKTAEQAETDKHINSLASALKRPGENSDSDFERIQGRVAGNGGPEALRDEARRARQAIQRKRAAYGVQ